MKVVYTFLNNSSKSGDFAQRGEIVKEFTETEKNFKYHPFQPIAISNFDKQQTGITLTAPLLPAFILKAGEDVAFWDNVTTATEYVIDIVTTFSGVGNIAKFRHLAKVASKANKLKFVSRTGKVLANAKAAARGAVGVIEISSGTVNALLKITNVRDEEWAKELSEFLLILEILALGADLSEFLLKRARTSAKNALKYEDEIRKQLDDVVIEDGKTTRKLTETDKGKFLDELKNIVNKKAKKISDDIDVLGSKAITKEELIEWTLKINSIKKCRLKSANLNQSVLKYMNENRVAAYFDGHEIPPIIWYKEGASKYIITHEYFHLEEFGKIGKKAFIKGDLGSLEEWHINNILREKYVAENMFKNANTFGFSENEILHIKNTIMK